MKTQMVYISAPISNVTPAQKARIRDLKHALRSTGIPVLEWISEGYGADTLYQRDMQNVHVASTVVAMIDPPSVHVGMEIAEAMRNHKPILCLHESESKVPRLLDAASRAYDLLRIVSYRNIEEAAAHVRAFVQYPAGVMQ